MTLSTDMFVLDEVDPAELFRFGQRLLAEYDELKRKPEEQIWHARDGWREDGTKRYANELGQGLPAIFDVTYREGGPVRAESQIDCNEDCEEDCSKNYHPRAHWLAINFDTAYGYRDKRGWGCGTLHAVLVARIGGWLDAKGVRWEWTNEFTGETHGGDQRYAKLMELGLGGAEAESWFRNIVMPAISTMHVD